MDPMTIATIASLVLGQAQKNQQEGETPYVGSQANKFAAMQRRQEGNEAIGNAQTGLDIFSKLYKPGAA